MNRTHSRRILGAVVAASIAFGLAACGDDSSDDAGTPDAGTDDAGTADAGTAGTVESATATETESATATAPDSESGSAAFPVTIDTVFGEVTIEAEPQRVVALGWADAETALALGVEPVGATDWLAFGGDGIGEWAPQYTAPPEIIPTDLNYEQIKALDPDVILNTRAGGDEEQNNLLSEIAPVVAIPAGDEAWGTPWDHQVTAVAAALGKQAEGLALIDEVDAAFTEAAAAHPEFDGKSVAVAAFFNGQWGGYLSKDLRVQFMAQLGFVNSELIEALDNGSFYAPIATEQLELLDADLTVAFPFSSADVPALEAEPLFGAVPSVADGRAVVLSTDDIIFAFSTGSAPALLYAIDTAVPLFADVVE